MYELTNHEKALMKELQQLSSYLHPIKPSNLCRFNFLWSQKNKIDKKFEEEYRDKKPSEGGTLC